jgi:hypothetical protein
MHLLPFPCFLSLATCHISPLHRDQADTTVIYVLTLLAIILHCIGWTFSGRDYGHWKDPDQWFLAQSCLLQILGVIVIYKTTTIRFDTRLWIPMLGSAAFSAAALIVYV